MTRAIARSPKAPRAYYLLARWLYTHLNRSDYVSWSSDVRRRSVPIGRRARAHYAAVLRACAALAVPLKVAEAHECIGNGVTRYLPSSFGMPALEREGAVTIFECPHTTVNAPLYRPQVIFAIEQDDFRKCSLTNWRQYDSKD